MNYPEALKFIYGGIDYEKNLPPVSATAYNLDRFRQLLRCLNSPQNKLKVVHIAGSKGKGSTAHYLSSILHNAGFTTGLYTSPHLCTPRERIRINGSPISPDLFAQAAGEVARAFSRENHADYRTVFEILTAMAFCAFQQQKVDIVVLETGLGGRLDATNVTNPILGIITPVVLEHTDILGKHLVQIAGEKAGIIKKGMEVLVTPQTPIVRDVIKDKVSECEAYYHSVGELVRCWGRKPLEKGESFVLGLGSPTERKLVIQLQNWGRTAVRAATTATAASLLLCRQGYIISREHIIGGLEQAQLKGRIEFYPKNPPLVIDVGHHPLAVKELVTALRERNQLRVVWIFGANRDKNWKKMLDLISPMAVEFHLCAAQTPRAEDANVLAMYLKGKGKPIFIHESVTEAIRAAFVDSREGMLTVVTGSFYVAGEVMRELGLCES